MPAGKAFVRKHLAYTVNGLRLFQQQSLFKVTFILAFAVVCEVGLFMLFFDAFRFLATFGGVAGLITGKLFSLFFLGMGIMLAVSGIVTSYSTFFRSAEVPYLLARPLSTDRIVTYKFYESTHFSSWAFCFVIIPFVGAFAVHEQFSLAFALWTLLFSVPFLVICSGIGTVIILLAVRWCPRRIRWQHVGAVVLLALAAFAWRASREISEGAGAQFALSSLVPGMVAASNMLIPSTWVADGVAALSRGDWARGGLLLGLTLSSAGVMILVVEGLGSLTFRRSWERVEAGDGKRHRASGVFRFGDRLLGWLPKDIGALIMKDVRTFFRDPMQWSQGLIFFGLLAMYFANLRTFNYHTYGIRWRNMVSFLNVFSVSAVLCSLGARFIYPQLSLEGQGFWLLGLSPTSMRRIISAKFGLSVACTLIVSLLLILLSSVMLDTDMETRWVSLALVSAVSIAVSGLSTGLGAIFMDLRERNPAAIVGGFGGTMNLVLSLAFMLLTILPAGLLFHLRAIEQLGPAGTQRGMLYLAAWLVGLTLTAVMVPMYLGTRALRMRDY